MRPDMENVLKEKDEIFKMKMKLSETSPSPDWTMNDLDEALANLKTTKQGIMKVLLMKSLKMVLSEQI